MTVLCLQAFTWIEPNLLAAGIYNDVQGVFQGCTVNGVTYLPSTSATQVGYFPAFVQILPVSPPSLLPAAYSAGRPRGCATTPLVTFHFVDSRRSPSFATFSSCAV